MQQPATPPSSPGVLHTGSGRLLVMLLVALLVLVAYMTVDERLGAETYAARSTVPVGPVAVAPLAARPAAPCPSAPPAARAPTPQMGDPSAVAPGPRKRFLLAITNCNGADMVDRLLSMSTLPAYTQPFIFDDASHEDVRDIKDVVAAHGAAMYQAMGPRGLTYAWNAAFHYFKVSPRNYSHMCVVNNDVVIPAGSLEALEVAMDSRPDLHVWGPVTMSGGLGAFLPILAEYAMNVSDPGGIYAQHQLNLVYPGVPHGLGGLINVEPQRAGEVQGYVTQSGILQAAMEAGGKAGVDAVFAAMGPNRSAGWPPYDAAGRPLNIAGRAHTGWAPPAAAPLIRIDAAQRHLLGFFLCMARTAIGRERLPSGDFVMDSLLNLHQESDIRDSGWAMAFASRAFVWHAKASTLSQKGGVDRNDLGVCHRRHSAAPTPTSLPSVTPPPSGSPSRAPPSSSGSGTPPQTPPPASVSAAAPPPSPAPLSPPSPSEAAAAESAVAAAAAAAAAAAPAVVASPP